MSLAADTAATTDAAGAQHARSAARRPTYRGYAGPAAVGLRDQGLAGRDDLLDLGEAELYRNPRCSEQHVLRGAALALLIGCTGATVEEIPEITYDPGRPLRDWIDLPGDGSVGARTVPLPEIAAIALRNYRKIAGGTSRCDRLFLGADGGPTSRLSIRKQFAVLGERIGIEGARVLLVLRHAYIAWTDASPDWETAAYLRGCGFAHKMPLQHEPSLSARKKLIEDHHPLGRIDREMLRWRGAVARRDDSHPLRALSAAGRKAVAAAKRKRGRHYPRELKEAVRDALASGRDPKAVFNHYGVSPMVLFDYVPRVRKKPYAKFEPLEADIRAKLEGPRTPSGKDMVAWLESEHGVVVQVWKLKSQLKRWGLAGRLGQARPSILEPYLDKIRATIPEGGVVDPDLVVELLANKGIVLTPGELLVKLRQRGITVPAIPAAFGSTVESNVLAWISVYPPPSLDTICRRLDDEYGVRLSRSQVSARIRAMGVAKIPATKNASPELNAIRPHLPAIKRYVLADPKKTWAAIAIWAAAEFGVEIEEPKLRASMVRLGVDKRALVREVRKPFLRRATEAKNRPKQASVRLAARTTSEEPDIKHQQEIA